jgi:hypothetical protein
MSIVCSAKKGYLFELKVKHILESNSFHLKRVGGACDKGVDLIGKIKNRNVIIQCKDELKVTGSNYIRELQGTLAVNTIGFLVTSNRWSKHAMNSLQFSDYPLVGIIVKEDKIVQAFANLKSQKQGVLIQKSLAGNIIIDIQ